MACRPREIEAILREVGASAGWSAGDGGRGSSGSVVGCLVRRQGDKPRIWQHAKWQPTFEQGTSTRLTEHLAGPLQFRWTVAVAAADFDSAPSVGWARTSAERHSSPRPGIVEGCARCAARGQPRSPCAAGATRYVPWGEVPELLAGGTVHRGHPGGLPVPRTRGHRGMPRLRRAAGSTRGASDPTRRGVSHICRYD